MTVLHVLDHSVPLQSGYSFRSRSIVIFQQRAGLRPVVLTSPKQGPTRAPLEWQDGIPHYRTGDAGAGLGRGLPFVRELRLMARLARRIAQVARRERAEVLHAHSPVLNGLPALWAGRRLGLPVVYEARAFWEDAAVENGTCGPTSLRYRVSRALESFLFRRADATVVICEGMRHDLLQRGIPATRLAVVPNGVDTDWFHPVPREASIADRFKLDGGATFGFVGSFYRYEGLRFLLEAAPELLWRLPGARILLVGAGRDEPVVRKMASAVGPAVALAGMVPHDQIRDVYSAIDVFVCPRRRTRLTELVTPLKPLEAMAMARPVLASDVGGLTELVTPEVTGLLFDADNQASFLEKAVRMGRDAALRQRLGAAARVHVVEQRGWGPIVSRYAEVYDEAADRRRGDAGPRGGTAAPHLPAGASR